MGEETLPQATTGLRRLRPPGWVWDPARRSQPLETWLAIQRARIAQRHLPDSVRSGRILDIGCGPAARFLNGVEAIEKEGVDELCQPYESTEVRRGTRYRLRLQPFDLSKHHPLPFEDTWFDAVVSLAVFEHVPRESVLTLLREIRRVLKPGGRCIITTPARGTETLLHGLSWLRLVDHDLASQHHRHFSLSELRAVFSEAGFPAASIRLGRFELGVNLWAVAQKGS